MNKSNTIPVSQYLGGKLVAKYPSIALASSLTNVQPAHIGKVANGLRKTAGGFSWKSSKKFSNKFTSKLFGVSQLDLNGNVLAIYESALSASTATGVSEKTINKVILGKSSRAGGFVWA